MASVTYIERDFPVERLNPVALSEGNSKKPVYRMHKWWARRLGSVFRTIILSAFSDADETSAGLWRKFCDGADLRGKVVLDPFVGGGTTIVEALRLGCKAIGADINPVAWFITKKEIEAVDLAALDAAFERLRKTAGKQIKEWYRTTCPCGHVSDVMYYFWVKIAECGKCGTRIRLFPNYELSRAKHANISVCPQCLGIIRAQEYHPETKCPECGTVFDPRVGVAARGACRCHECGEINQVLEAVRRKGTALDMELHAVEGYCESCGRFFKRADEGDLTRLEQAKTEFARRKEKLLYPHQLIPTQGRSDPRPVNHGYTYFWQMFNERQLLCLSILLENILTIPEQNVRELMLIAFSDCLNTNNMFCKYEVDWHKISLFFSLHAFHPIERPTENNVWGTVFGRGTFVKCFEKVRKAKVYCQHPYERLLDPHGRRYSKQTGDERIEGRLVVRFDEVAGTERAALLRCQSSEDLSFVPDRSVDAVITDPPYFDNVQYSELADFFYVWLRPGLKDTYPWFTPELSSRPSEIVKNDNLGKTTAFFNQGLCRVFTECRRVLKDQGLLIFTFHHNKIWAWEGMAQLLMDAGFYVSAAPVVRSEGRGEVHSSEGNIRFDCVLVCRKLTSPATPTRWTLLRKTILRETAVWTKRTLESGMPITAVDVFVIGMGKTIEYYTKCFGNNAQGGQQPPLGEALQEIAGIVRNAGTNTLAAKQSGLPKAHAKTIEQLALFVSESQERYGGVGPRRTKTA